MHILKVYVRSYKRLEYVIKRCKNVRDSKKHLTTSSLHLTGDKRAAAVWQETLNMKSAGLCSIHPCCLQGTDTICHIPYVMFVFWQLYKIFLPCEFIILRISILTWVYSNHTTSLTRPPCWTNINTRLTTFPNVFTTFNTFTKQFF